MINEILGAIERARPCRECGAGSEYNGFQVVETHHMGCSISALRRTYNEHKAIVAEFGPENENPEPAPIEARCEHPGCSLPKRLPKGKRPTQYCEEHSTNAATLERRRLKEGNE